VHGRPYTSTMTRRVAVIPHTHWDREWYSPYQTFRMRLVDLLDELLTMLETDPSYAHFQLDGQMAVVDDYLEVRPEAEETLRALAASGRLSMGPWYALPDEFLVSGETLVRNLQLGLRRAAAFGGAMAVGYLPDMFGHVAQMPQIFAQLGFEHAVVWRGVPAAVTGDAFWWEAPDGSTVRAEYLLEGYGNGAFVPDDAKALATRVGHWETDHGARLSGDILWMNGTDHLMPQPWLGRVATEANDTQEDYRFAVTSLPDYLAAQPTEGLTRWVGELRSGARANLLMGVASNRTDVRQAAAGAERALERVAEPLAALYLPVERWPASLLDIAWREMARNSAHDSVCACSVDEVCDAVLVRYAEVSSVAAGVAERAVHALGARMAEAGAVVVNPTARPRGGLVELRLAGAEPASPDAEQVLSVSGGDGTLELTRADASALVGDLLNHRDGFCEVSVDLGDDGVLEVDLLRRFDAPTRLVAANVVNEMRATGTDDPEAPARVRITRPPSRRSLVRVDEVPGFGWCRLDAANPVQDAEVAPVLVTVGGPVTMANGRVTVTVDPTTATWSLTGPDGTATAHLGRLVDGGDSGDTYNYNPPPTDVVVADPESVTVTVLERGPLRARVRIDAIYRWPEQVEGDTRVGDVEVPVATTLEVRAGEDLVRVATAFTNRCRDHRLRAHLPLPAPASVSHAECAFTVVRRGVTAEGGPTERALPTYPSRRFVSAGGLTVIHDGLLEYELVDVGDDGAARELALTLVRCTGMLSQGPMEYRPLPAGPLVATEGAQLQGPVEVRYALALGAGDPYGWADEAFTPLVVTDAPGGGPETGETGAGLEVRGAEVSAVLRQGGVLVVRVFNPTDEPTTVEVPGRRGWLVDLRGRPVEPFEASFVLGSHRIATLHLD
jgi:mannosylglycerate hydrolase